MPKNFPEFTIPDDESARNEAIRDLLPKAVSEFEDVAGSKDGDDGIDIEVLSGGITNQLFRVKRRSTGFTVVVRVYGKETERLISREAEQFWQAAFLRTFAHFKNGLIYEYLTGHEPIQPEELPQHADAIAVATARFHRRAAQHGMIAIPYATEAVFADVVLEDWAYSGTDAAGAIRERGKGDVAAEYGDLTEFRDEARRLQQAIDSVKSVVAIVPCHNDLLSLNIMRDSSNGELRFIDFEYARRNYYLADIANHLCEYSGFDNNWSAYPDEQAQRRFMERYLAEAMDSCTPEARAAELRRATRLLPLFALLSCMTWAAWALVQAAYSAIDFDYVSFGRDRYRQYKRLAPGAYAAAAAVAEEVAEAARE